MEFKFAINGSQLLLTPESGFQLHCGLAMVEEPEFLELKSGKRWQEANYSIHIYPLATSPRKDDEFEDNRIGEFNVLAHARTQPCFFKAWMHVPGDHFNVLYAELSKRNERVNLELCFNEDETPSTASGVYDDSGGDTGVMLLPAASMIPVMTYRVWVGLTPYPKDASSHS